MEPRNNKPLKILSLKAENVKRLKAVHITPGQHVEIIGGRNGQGKTSVLDAIAMAIEGKASACQQPVRAGESKAMVQIDLGDLIVKRSFTPAGGGTLTVTSRDGAKYSSPQRMLDDLVGTLAFDPLAFSRMKPKEQFETLRELLGINTTLLDNQRQSVYDDRTEVNRALKQQEAELARLEAAVDGKREPAGDADLGELTAALEKAKEHNAGNEKLRARLEEVKRGEAEIRENIAEEEQRIEKIKAELAQAEADLATMKEDHAKAIASLEKGTAIVAELADEDEGAIMEKIRTFQDAARLKDAFTAVRAGREEAEKLRVRSEELTSLIENIDQRKRDRIASANYPVTGLSLGESGLLFNNVPFEQASAAEQLKVSVAMGIAMNPRLKVILIRDGSLLDDDSLAMIGQMAAEHDAQVWIERVGHGEECSVIIEDGEILEGGAQ